ncbi:polyisoprenoid-binding protein [Glaciimonas sp. GS1]|uniref:Polyisoprenoid-binding protein n=2 Tax=Glaciimonas soli TaxID=2590999 RepID=A0A843YNL1_9BURK|nr:polyisoprenoid-binding protein [Glaciimonas soli]
MLLTALSGPSFAVDHYKIDPDHTFTSFEYSHWGLSVQRGRFDNISGSIAIDPDAKTGTIDINIDTASVNTGSDAFNQTLRSSDFFDAEHHPDIHFISSRLVFDGDVLKQVEGNLTVKGVTHPVTLEIDHYSCRFMFIYGKQACGANGAAEILRSDYNLGRYAPFVSDAVTLHIVVEAIKDYP